MEDKIEEAEKRREEKIRQVEKEFNKQLRPLYDGINFSHDTREWRSVVRSGFVFATPSLPRPRIARRPAELATHADKIFVPLSKNHVERKD